MRSPAPEFRRPAREEARRFFFLNFLPGLCAIIRPMSGVMAGGDALTRSATAHREVGSNKCSREDFSHPPVTSVTGISRYFEAF